MSLFDLLNCINTEIKNKNNERDEIVNMICMDKFDKDMSKIIIAIDKKRINVLFIKDSEQIKVIKNNFNLLFKINCFSINEYSIEDIVEFSYYLNINNKVVLEIQFIYDDIIYFNCKKYTLIILTKNEYEKILELIRMNNVIVDVDITFDCRTNRM